MSFARCDDPPPAPTTPVRDAVVIATLSAIATGLVSWAIDEARERWGHTKRARSKR